MPSTYVTIQLKVHNHKTRSSALNPNDMYDFAALANAVPYCDIVFTDHAARKALLARHVDSYLSTSLPRDANDLVALLS